MGIKVSIIIVLLNQWVFDTAVKSSVHNFLNISLLRVKLYVVSLQGEDEAEAAKPLNDEGLKTLQKQEEMFRNLDVQYEMARSQTHTQRGMGLGFTSSFSRGMDSI